MMNIAWIFRNLMKGKLKRILYSKTAGVRIYEKLYKYERFNNRKRKGGIL